MAQPQALGFHLGVVDRQDASTLKTGELALGAGCEYHPGSTHLYKASGRTSTTNDLLAAVQALHKFVYGTGDVTDDKFIGVAAGDVYESAVSTAPTFSISNLIGLDTDAAYSFAHHQNTWLMVNGVDANYLRESSAVNVTGWTLGNWRTVGMEAPQYTLTVDQVTAAGADFATLTVLSITPTFATDSYSYDNTDDATEDAIADNDDDSYAWCRLDKDNSIADKILILDVTDTSMDASTDRYFLLKLGFYENWFLEGSPHNPLISAMYEQPTIKVELSENAGGDWDTIYFRKGNIGDILLGPEISDGVTLSTQFQVRISAFYSDALSPFFDYPLNSAWARVYAARIMTGTGAAGIIPTMTTGVKYGITEEYIDENGVPHESSISPRTPEYWNVDGISHTGLAITWPTDVTNDKATNFKLYRSIDEEGGGWPNLWLLASAPVADAGTTFYDTLGFDVGTDPSVTPTASPLLETLQILFPDGSTSFISMNDAPPIAKKVFVFEGSMCYVAAAYRNRLYYSVPSTVTPASMEKVPVHYYLEFNTQYDDSIVTAGTANGGRTILAYFKRQTLVVHHLPQATDAGIFDTRIKEYVSESRGAGGINCVAELSLATGQTLTAAVDSLGLWVTNGVSTLQDWSRDTDWPTILSGVDLSNAELRDNPEKRRLEFTYLDGAQWKEMTFFYDRFRQDSSGQQAPLILGPTPVGYRTKIHTIVSDAWEAFSGDSSVDGDVFLEEQGTADAANGYDVSGNINFVVESGEFYFGGLDQASLTVFGYPKFERLAGTKAITVTSTFKRDGGDNEVATKTFTIGSQRKLYWHKYADAYQIKFQDTSTTALPALVAYTAEVRGAGEGRDK